MSYMTSSQSVIHYRLTLLLRLIDTAVGKPIHTEGVQVLFNNNKISVHPKHGYYLIMNLPREDVCCIIKVLGYEESEILIKYDQLDPEVPIQTIYLIPQVTKRNMDTIHDLQGTCMGIEYLEGVSLSSRFCLRIQQYQEDTRSITVSNPNKLTFYQERYAILNTENHTFESIQINEQLSFNIFRITEPLGSMTRNGRNLLPLIYGKVDSQGNYLFRAERIENNQKFLMHYMKNGQEVFQYYDTQSKELLM